MLGFLQKATAAAGRGLMTVFVRAAFRPKVRYIDKNRKKRRFGEPVIFVGNHTSHMDGLLTSVVFAPYKGCILVAKDWYEKPKINWFLKNNRCIPMDRFGLDTGWLRLSSAAVKNGESVIIYPEGRTGKEEEPREFKSGFVMLAVMTKAKIVPYAVDGDYKILFGKRQRMLIGEPVELTAEGKGLRPEYLEKESERFRQLVIELKHKIKEEL